MKVAVGSDHGGFRMKEEVLELLRKEKVEFEDLGVFSSEAIDYPDIACKIAREVAKGNFSRGIIVCGTGIGVSIAANKIKGIRAALCNDVFSAQMSRAHNDANILTLGERVIGSGIAAMIVNTWLNTEFEGGRHAKRVAKITKLEA